MKRKHGNDDAPSRDAGSIDEMADEAQAFLWRHKAERARYGADPRARGFARDEVCEFLEAGELPPEPLLAWAIYVLRNLDPKKIPAEHKGRHSDSQRQWARIRRLVDWWLESERTDPKLPVIERRQLASDQLRLSESVVKRLLYSEEFKTLRDAIVNTRARQGSAQ